MAKNEYNSFKALERSLRWFRGMSEKQLNGCNKLLHALRDDIEQESTYRVHECLSILGLTPMLTSAQIKSIMALSSESDLAFLWFIWEAFYKKSHDCNSEIEHYSINEQLILSAIAHLDMTTTMRALDQILPTSEHSKKYQDQQRIERQKKEEKKRKQREERRTVPPFIMDMSVPYHQRVRQLRELRKMGKNHNPPPLKDDKILPYLMPQLRPKLYGPITLKSTPINRKVIFPTYESYKDKHHRIPNESSRWFSSYDLSPVKREIKKCMSDALAPIFGGSRMPLKKSVCNVHRMLEFAASRKEQELTCQTMQRCMKLLSGQQEERKRLHIIHQLEEDVECAALRLHYDARRQLTQLQQLIGGTCNIGKGCQMCSKLISIPGFIERPERRADLSFLLGYDFTLSHPIPDETENTPVKVYELREKRLMKYLTVEEDRSLRNTLGSNAYGCQQGKGRRTGIRCVPTEGIIKVLNDQGEVIKRIKPSELFCPPTRKSSDTSADRFCSRKTMKSGVLQWDYFKIYQQSTVSPTPSVEQFRDKGPIIRSYCIDALNQAMKRSTGQGDLKRKSHKVETPNRIFRSIQSDSALEAAEKTAKLQFKESLKSKSLTAYIERRSLEDDNLICKKVSAEKFKALGSIDPDNKAMLIKLLKIAVDIMQQDPQYVLVTLPNAHMMPVLVDWVAERYGKTYNYHQMRHLAKSMRLVYDRLNPATSISQSVPHPNKKYVRGYKWIESYGKYHEYVCKAGQSQDNYYRKLNQMALEESRVIWLAMHGYCNLAGSITDTYFAYLPAKELDFVRHHQWNSRDFRDMAPHRKKRREKETKR